jgi:hypothetical protein
VRFFFYGTLIDPDVRRAVLGAHAPDSVESATLGGWERLPVRGESYPMIRRRGGARVEGVLARGLDAEARSVLVGYEGADYALVAVDVALLSGRRLPAWVFAPAAGGALAAGEGAWRFEEWERRHKSGFIRQLAPGRATPRG